MFIVMSRNQKFTTGQVYILYLNPIQDHISGLAKIDSKVLTMSHAQRPKL